MKESTIQQQIVDYLTHIASTARKPIFFFAPMNETAMMTALIFMSEILGKKISENKLPEWAKKLLGRILMHLKKMGMVPGTPDLVFSYCGQTIYFELKIPGKEPSDKQKMIHEKIRSTGHRVEVVRSLDEFKKIMLLCGVVE